VEDHDEQKHSQGVVTPTTGDVSFADPLADAAEQFKRRQQQQQQGGGGYNVANNGDMAGELSQVQNMIAVNQQQQNQAPQQPQITARAPIVMASAKEQIQALPKPPASVAAPAATMKRQPLPSAVPVQMNKRPRVDAPAGQQLVSFTGKSSVPSQANTNQSTYPRTLTAASAAAAAQQASVRGKSQSQIDRRRERNRILARRTRLRKKFFFESLQKDVADLQRENAALKSIVRSRLKPDDARAILTTCNANEKLPSIINEPEDDMGMGGGSADVKKLDKEDFNLIQSIQNSQQCFIITDPSLHDNPIVYASNDFLNLTGYAQEEVLGRNCRFLQGTETSREKVAMIRKAVSVGEDCNVTLVNYRSDGTPFWNSLFIAALRDAEDNIVNFIGVIVKVAGPEPGDQEYGKVLSS
jgi:PAS domain S-box-containing protein